MTDSNKYNPQDDPVLKDFISRLEEELGEHLKGAILFGPRARGETDEDSDYDILVLVDEENKERDKKISEISYKMMVEHEALVVAVTYPEKEFKRRKYAPLFINVRREGFTLYDR